MSNSSDDSDEDNRVRNVSNLLLKSKLNNDIGVDFGQARKKKHGHLIFDASFEGGNLGRVDQVDQHEYELFIRPDVANPRYRIWFNFTVQNTKLNQCVIFNIVNLSEDIHFYYEGFTPVVRSQTRPNWVRMRESQVFYYRCPRHKWRHVLSMTFKFDDQQDIYQFALNYPYTSTKLQSYIDRWLLELSRTSSPSWSDYGDSDDLAPLAGQRGPPSSRCLSPTPSALADKPHFISTRRLSQATVSCKTLTDIHSLGFNLAPHHHKSLSEHHHHHQHHHHHSQHYQEARAKRRKGILMRAQCNPWLQSRIVAKSHMGRPIIRFTITKPADEPQHASSCLSVGALLSPSPVQPARRMSPIGEQLGPSALVAKRTIVVLCRIHPSESPASFVCQGLIDFLMNSRDGMAQLARQFFTFEIFPMVDPDSVAAGNSRTSILGQDLDMVWSGANDVAEPSLSGIKHELLALLNGADRQVSPVDTIIDIHANFQECGASVTGTLYKDIVRMERHALFPKLLSSILEDFYIEQCNFRDIDEAYTLAGRGQSESIGLHQLVHQHNQSADCYTLEVSHFGYYNRSSLGQEICNYDQQSYMRLGKGLVYALVDLHRHTGHIPIASIPVELQQLMDGYHADETNAFKLSLIRN